MNGFQDGAMKAHGTFKQIPLSLGPVSRSTAIMNFFAGIAFIFFVMIGLCLLEASGRLRSPKSRRGLRIAATVTLGLSVTAAAVCVIPVLFGAPFSLGF
jgi:hypothetical protein